MSLKDIRFLREETGLRTEEPMQNRGAAVAFAFIFFLLSSCGDGGDAPLNVNTLNGATGVPVNASFQYIASPQFDPDTVTAETYFIVPVTSVDISAYAKAPIDDTVCDPTNALAASQHQTLSTFFNLRPSANLAYGTLYAICLTEEIKYQTEDSIGQVFNGFMARFTTIESPSSVTVTLSPANGSAGLPLDTAVTAVFSGAITEPSDWSSVFTLKKEGAGDNLCTAITYDDGALTATCEHAVFERLAAYTTEVIGLKDAAGGDIAEASSIFSMTPAIKLLRPDGTEMDLSGTPIPYSARIKYSFGEAFSEETQRIDFEAEAIVQDEDGNNVTGAFAWAEDYMSVIFTPARKLKYSMEYTIEVGTSSTFTTMTFGDINGDGFADLFLGARQYQAGSKLGAAYIFNGSASGIPSCNLGAGCTADTTMLGGQAGDMFGTAAEIAGDVNGDGYSDILVSAYTWPASASRGRVYVFYGSDAGIADCNLGGGCTPNATITGVADGDEFGYTEGGVGDVNNDGYDDIVIGAAGVPGGAYKGAAYIFHGSANGIIAECDMGTGCTADATITGAANADSLTWYSATTAGDINNDGYSDVAIGADQMFSVTDTRGMAYIFYGSASGIADCDLGAGCTAGAKITGAENGDFLGDYAGAAGDLNRDGYGDLVVTASTAPNTGIQSGTAYIFYGSATGITNCDMSSGCVADVTIIGREQFDALGYTAKGNGDVNGDGHDDLVLGAPFSQSLSSLTVTLAPSNQKLNQTAAAAVTAKFSNTIVEPSDWSSAFNLKKDGAGASLCTSVTYNAGTLTATCAHANFVGASLYEVKVSGIKDDRGLDITTAGSRFTATGAPAPIVAMPSPADDATGVATDSAVTVKFSGEIVEPADWNSAVTLRKDGAGASLCTSVTYVAGLCTTAANCKATCAHAAFDQFSTYTLQVSGITGVTDVSTSFTTILSPGSAYVFYGSATGIPDCDLGGACTAQYNTVTGALAGWQLADSIVQLTDINNDGYDEVILNDYSYPNENNKGQEYIFLGSAAGIADCDIWNGCTPDATLTGENDGDLFGYEF